VVRSVEHRSADFVSRAGDKARLRTRARRATRNERVEAGLEREAAERDDDPRARDEADLADQVLAAVGELLRERSVVGRSALDGRGQESAGELEPVSGSD
jgi:hypothetical protein